MAYPTPDMGWINGFSFDEEGALTDPRLRDDLFYRGLSRGHVNDGRASEIGMHRAYGYGATMAAWNTDYLALWPDNLPPQLSMNKAQATR